MTRGSASGKQLAFIASDLHLSDPDYLFASDGLVLTGAVVGGSYIGGDGTLSGLGVVVHRGHVATAPGLPQ